MKDTTDIAGESARKFDFSKYRSREVVDKISELLNIRGSFVNVIRTAAYLEVAMFIVFVAIWLLISDLAFIEAVFLALFILLIGVVLGVLLGLLRIVDKSLANIEGVLTILLDSSNQAAVDFAAMRSGDVEIPSGKEIVAGMYEQVIMPSIEEVVSEAFGFLGKPILWMYRKTIGTAVSRLLIAAYVKEHGITDERISADVLNTADVDQAVSEVSAATQPALRYIESAKSVVATIGGGLRSYALRPLYIVFWFLLSIALTPVIAYVVLFGMPE